MNKVNQKPTGPPRSKELGDDLRRLLHEEQQRADQRRAEELARLRELQRYD